MATAKQLHRLATNPADLVRYQRTGRLPQGIKPSSPLITLLEQIGGRDQLLIRGLTVDERLGYSGSRRFETATQAMHWLKPAPEVFGAFAAESWRIKSFARELSIEDLAACCAGFPAHLSTRLVERNAAAPRRRS
jgi:hypothetical protein